MSGRCWSKDYSKTYARRHWRGKVGTDRGWRRTTSPRHDRTRVGDGRRDFRTGDKGSGVCRKPRRRTSYSETPDSLTHPSVQMSDTGGRWSEPRSYTRSRGGVYSDGGVVRCNLGHPLRRAYPRRRTTTRHGYCGTYSRTTGRPEPIVRLRPIQHPRYCERRIFPTTRGKTGETVVTLVGVRQTGDRGRRNRTIGSTVRQSGDRVENEWGVRM